MHRIIANTLLGSAGLLFGMSQVASADVDELRAFVAKKAGIVELLHNKAERALVTSAQDTAYRQYFEATTDEERAQLRERIDHIGLAVQKKFAVEEMCLIDETGTEISRIVRREIAYDLSTEEASANFFAPTFAAAPRTVYLAPIYMSPDVHRWVTAYATPIDVRGDKKAILHYEHGLDFYEELLNAGLDPSGKRVLLTATSDGWVIFDSRKRIPIEQVGESEDPADYFDQLSVGGLSLTEIRDSVGSGSDEGAALITGSGGISYEVAYKTLGDWTLIAFEQSGEAALEGVEILRPTL